MRETWHAATNRNVFDPSTELRTSPSTELRTGLVRHWYTNGRPSRMERASTSSDLQYLNSYVIWYLQYNWHGEAATHHLTTLTKDLGGSLTTYTFQYDSLSRITQFCSGVTTCSNFYYEGESDWLSHVTDYSGTLISHYYYANGKPFAVDLRNVWGGYDRDYYRYNWHGDVSAVMDSNGNGDGWNNVSPFGDNGNGAYPANPNLEQYYGYGGAWGYLYFNGVLGGTNTVRSVDLYYIHGRWWHPDMGLFLSPNAKGDYLYGGDGPDPANKGWVPLLMPQLQLPDNGYINTRDYGFIDIKHMSEARDVTNTILEFMNDMTRPNPLALTAVGTGKAGAGHRIGRFNYFEGLDAWYDINRPVPTQLQDEVALGILLDYERRWENLQGRSLSQGGSGYSPEDLPSDYLGFYSAVTRKEVPVILDDILKEKGKYKTQDDKPWWLDSRMGGIPNMSIDPMVCNFDWGLTLPWGVACVIKPWPDTMRIREETQGIYWHLDHCEGYSTLDIGPYHRRDPNLGCQ